MTPACAAAQVTAAPVCTKLAATTGSDRGTGTPARPYRTVQRLADSLRPGQTGCVRAGTYSEYVKLTHGGTADARVTLRSFPGERAQLVGQLYLARGADFVTVSYLDLDGANPTRHPSPTINANDVVFTDNDVSNRHTGICFVVGSETWGHAARTVIARNRIHDCGILPPTNEHHGIYVEDATDTLIDSNVIYDNSDLGVHLYPNADRTTVTHNVIDGNGIGVIFSGADGKTSSDNLVANNVITNSRVRFNVESWYPPGTPIGTGNVVRNNCIFGGVRDTGNGSIQTPENGYTTIDTTIADPGYAAPADGDFTLRSGSPCAAMLDGAPVPTLVLPLAPSGADAGSALPAAPTPLPLPTPVPATSIVSAPTGAAKQRRRSSRGLVSVASGKSVRAGARLRVRARVRRAGGTSRRRVLVQLRHGARWRTIARGRLDGGGRAVVLARIRSAAPARSVHVRAVVPGVGHSASVRVAVRR